MKKLTMIIFLFLAGCNLRPHYEYDIVMPCEWRLSLDECEEVVNVRFWEQFDDPILNSLIAAAMHNNLDLKKAVARVVQYFALFQKEGTGLPTIKGLAGIERFDSFEPFPGIGPITANQVKAFAVVNFEADVWGRLLNARDAAYENYLSQIEAKRTVVLTVVSQVASAYIDLRALDEQLLIANKTWHARVKSLNLNELLFKEGLVSKLEIEQSQTEVEAALAEVKKYETLIPQQENLISLLIGENPSEILRGRSIDTFKIPFCIPTGLPVELLERRPDIREAEKKLMASEAQIGVIRASFFPKISLSALIGYVTNFASNPTSNSNRGLAYDVAALLLQDIFDDGKKEAELLAVTAINREDFYDYKLKILTALKEVNDAMIAHQKAKELVEVANDELQAYKEYYRLADLQHQNGFVDYLNVLYAKNNLFASELRFVARQGDTFKTLIDLYKALGGGWVYAAEEISAENCN